MPQTSVADQPLCEPDVLPPSELPFYAEVLAWVSRSLRPAGFPKPLCKRLALLVAGLVTSEGATIGEVTTAVQALAISNAKEASIARRLQRTLRDARLDPTLLPRLLRPLLPELLHASLLSHEANKGTSTFHHERFRGLTIVLDESSKEDEVHLLVAGIPFAGVVLPLAVRAWAQNAALPQGEYWTQVTGLLQEVQAALPPALREHVLLVANRAYGVPRMLGLLTALGWHWLLRVQGTTTVRLRSGECCPLRALVPREGTQWTSGFGSKADGNEGEEAVGVFRGAGWRGSQVVALWAQGQAEPWLLLTSLPARQARLAEYAQRWAIERLFLSWKSHGWDLERSGLRTPQRLGRLLTGIALATLWRLAIALPSALRQLADLEARVSERPRQLPLPGFASPAPPWEAKYSLLTWGAKVATRVPLATKTPARCWRFPPWQGRSWLSICRQARLLATGQFSAAL